MRILRDVVAIYLGLLTLLYSFQTRVIFPGASTQGQPFAQVRPRPGHRAGHTRRPARGERVVALFGPAMTSDGRPDPDAASRPTMIYFYGNAMCLNYASPGPRSIPPAGSERAHSRLRGLWHERRQSLRKGMSGHGRRRIRLSGLDSTSRLQDHHLRRLVAGRSGRDRPGLAPAGRRADRLLDLHERRRHGPANVALRSGLALLRHRFDSVHKIAKVRCPISDRPRPPRPAHSLSHGRKARGIRRRPGHHALDRPGRAQRLLRRGGNEESIKRSRSLSGSTCAEDGNHSELAYAAAAIL